MVSSLFRVSGQLGSGHLGFRLFRVSVVSGFGSSRVSGVSGFGCFGFLTFSIYVVSDFELHIFIISSSLFSMYI